ncbi:MAG: 50S ribosomal protein L25 [Phycisphaeraceae bacterium]|nr:50S ribosomal protein L25 [Phycisphaeraceae bacterium]
MHEKQPTLVASKRDRVGSRYAKRFRTAGKLPANVYGHGRPPIAIAVDAKEAITHIHRGEKVFKLDFPGHSDMDEGQIVLLKELQFDHLGTNIVHADFARVDLNELVKVKVHINLIGDAKGLKEAGAIMMHPTAEIEIECRLVDMPDGIDVSVAELEAGHSITAGDVKLPAEGMRLITDVHAIVAQIVIQKAIEEKTEAAAVEAGAAEPVVLTAKKPAEGEEAKPGAKAAPGKDAPKKEEKKK